VAVVRQANANANSNVRIATLEFRTDFVGFSAETCEA
jgi:hypothetical protein